ncbi:FMN-binding protein [Rhodococcoides fascians]|uniref:FMN-binding protein n=1 Tax=Rhodococcoides fascians TaxID=1828 RepID=UPI0005602110|nr:hypothetical protein [Rhodococcus fascians]
MMTPVLTRAAVGAAASVAVLFPLSGCSSGQPTSTSTPAPLRTDSPADSAVPSETADAGPSEYAAGTYTARGYYGGAPSYMTFTVTLDNGLITDVESELMPDNNDTSRGYQERFAEALPDEVVGRSVDEVEVGVLAGSSSCGDGFNDALAQIREQASTNS